MTLTEALNASKETNGYYSRPDKHLTLCVRWDQTGILYVLTAEDLLADDWEPVFTLAVSQTITVYPYPGTYPRTVYYHADYAYPQYSPPPGTVLTGAYRVSYGPNVGQPYP